MLDMFKNFKNNIQNKMNINHHINEAEKIADFGKLANENYFFPNKCELNRLFQSAHDLKKLSQANKYIAKKLISLKKDVISSYAVSDDDVASLLNALYIVDLYEHSLTTSLLGKINFNVFMQLESEMQSYLVDKHSEMISLLFTSMDQIISFTSVDKNRTYSPRSLDVISLIKNHPVHMLSLIKDTNDLIKLSKVDWARRYPAVRFAPSCSVSEYITLMHAKELMPILKSANDVIKLASCKEFIYLGNLIVQNKSAVLELFHGDLNLFRKLKEADKSTSTFTMLIKFNDSCTKDQELAMQDAKNKHDPKMFAMNNKDGQPHASHEVVASQVRRKPSPF